MCYSFVTKQKPQILYAGIENVIMKMNCFELLLAIRNLGKTYMAKEMCDKWVDMAETCSQIFINGQ